MGPTFVHASVVETGFAVATGEPCRSVHIRDIVTVARHNQPRFKQTIVPAALRVYLCHVEVVGGVVLKQR